MGIELVEHENPFCRGVGGNGFPNVFDKVGFGASGADGRGDEFAGADLEVGDETNCAVPRVLEFSSFDLAGRRWFRWSVSFERLNASFFVAAHDVNALLIELSRRHVEVADFCGLLGELLKVFNVGVEPVTRKMRAQVCFFLKSGRHVDRRCS